MNLRTLNKSEALNTKTLKPKTLRLTPKVLNLLNPFVDPSLINNPPLIDRDDRRDPDASTGPLKEREFMYQQTLNPKHVEPVTKDVLRSIPPTFIPKP